MTKEGNIWYNFTHKEELQKDEGDSSNMMNKMQDTVKSLAQDIFESKIKEFISHEKTKNSLRKLITDLDDFLIKTFGGEEYFSSLYRYVHNGTNFHDVYGDEGLSAFYCSLICAFFDSDDGYLGKTKFPNYHWIRMNEKYSDSRYDEEKIKRYFLYCYTTFKEQFSSFSSSEGRTIINSIIESINDTVTPLGEILKQLIDKNESFSAVESDPAVVSRFVSNQIHDDNREYEELHCDTLFLEAKLEDNKKATLNDTYVKPCISSDKYYNFDLDKWIYDRDSRILLLYGKAGIGKTSFVSWLAFEHWLERDCHILKLRDYIGILNSRNPWESVKKCFKCEDENLYQNAVLILDGLDEVCVLDHEFDGYKFIENLSHTLRTGFGRHIRVVVTSRVGYFSEIIRDLHIEKATITWNETSVRQWCDSYCNIHTNRTDWCKSFKKKYSALYWDDKRREAFCSPIILYICCVSRIDISEHSSVASVYEKAFHMIGRKEYHVINEKTGKEFEINWQFTKEIAFQMFLNGELGGVLESNWVNIAKEKTIQWGKKEYGNEDINPEFNKIFALNHFAFKKNNAVEFAHKTVGEYFTATKFYEDYFKPLFNAREGESLKEIPLAVAKEVWRSIFNAFRYKWIPQDIMTYLTELIKNNKQSKSWKLKFFKSYYMGLTKQFLVAVANEESKYRTTYIALIKQIRLAFRNLTWLLTGLGFDNDEFNNTTENLEILASCINGDVNLSGWKNLEGIDLSVKNLSRANFSRCSLNESIFKRSILKSSTFVKASLNDVDFSGAHLGSARLKEAHIERSNFYNADLQMAQLQKTHSEMALFPYANFKDAQLQGAHFENAQFQGAYFEKARFQNAHFENAQLQNAHFEESLLGYAYFEKAKFQNAHFKKARFEHAHFENTQLQNAHFEEPEFESTHFEGACLNNVNLVRAHFRMTHLEQAKLENVCWGDGTPVHLVSVFLFESDLSKFDNYIQNRELIFFRPIIATDDNRKVYNPETNRMEIKEEL